VFAAYTTNQLCSIIEERLLSVPNIITMTEGNQTAMHDAIKNAAMKIGRMSGDARRALNLYRYVIWGLYDTTTTTTTTTTKRTPLRRQHNT